MSIILGIESSCDETSCAIVKDGREILSNVIYSQVSLHREYGGVVPEIASRMHIEKISQVVDSALNEASLSFNQIDAISVTYGPGLVGALLCGVSYAKALAYSLKKPLVKVHHIKGHIAANYLTHQDLKPPFLCLVVSGGHSHIIEVKDYNSYSIVAKTRDDAAGEAFDKIGRTLNIPYPGGAMIDKIAYKGDKNAVTFPRVTFNDSYDFSFSGLKTAVINYIHRIEQKNPDLMKADFEDVVLNERLNGNGVCQNIDEITKADILASFTDAVVSILTENTIKVAKERGYDSIVLAGGVACNSHLRQSFDIACKENNMTVKYPEPILCTDNAAMIASMGYYLYKDDQLADLNLNAIPYIDIENN